MIEKVLILKSQNLLVPREPANIKSVATKHGACSLHFPFFFPLQEKDVSPRHSLPSNDSGKFFNNHLHMFDALRNSTFRKLN